MDKIFEPLFKLLDNPLTEWLKSVGLNEDFSKAISAAIIAAIVWSIVAGLKWLHQWVTDSKTAKELVHFRYDYKDVQNKRKLFVPTQGQNNTPTYEEEPEKGIKFIVKKPLIPFFINTAFNEKKDSDKFYLILADSGMGKTTFMINLYLQYHSLFNFRRKYKMKLFPFGDKNIIKWIQEIKTEEARDTILLLDAFDEYKALLPPERPDGLSDDERFRKRLDEVIESVKDFREVVITSRTQYFPGQEDKPYELKIPRYGREGFHTLAKLYISPFEKKETKQFLNKKYGIVRFWNRHKKKVAASVVERSPKLMVRPMLLSYIDFLVDDNLRFENTSQIYEALINKWIEREADKRKHKSEDREKFKRELFEFSQLAALEIYEKRKQNSLLTKEEAIAICEKHKLDLLDYEITGQSLLTRDASHNWKFAHKSILEYFLARECEADWQFAIRFNLVGMDMVAHFYNEMIPYFSAFDFVKIEGGMFNMGSDDKSSEKPRHEVTVSDFYMARIPVTQKQWRDIMGNNPSHFKNCDNCPVESVSWNDVQEFLIKLKAKTGNSFCLPSEAQWEYAARGGNKSKGYIYSGSNNIDEVGWYLDNSDKKTHPVALKQPNELFMYDMSGNMWEWCQDKWHDNYDGAPVDGNAWEEGKDGSGRVRRGGGWSGGAQYCRSADRSGRHPELRGTDVGFRLVFLP